MGRDNDQLLWAGQAIGVMGLIGAVYDIEIDTREVCLTSGPRDGKNKIDSVGRDDQHTAAIHRLRSSPLSPQGDISCRCHQPTTKPSLTSRSICATPFRNCRAKPTCVRPPPPTPATTVPLCAVPCNRADGLKRNSRRNSLQIGSPVSRGFCGP
jgi:hypothetical protein